MPVRRASLPAITPAHRRALVALGAVVAVSIWIVIVALAEPYDWSRVGVGHDARPYWTAAFTQPYATSRVGAHDAYLYSPVFLELIAPLRALPWQLFMAGWTAVLIGATLYVVGPVLLGPALLLALPEVVGGNITLLLGAAIVAGFRFPGAWAFPLLTKVTPGAGLIWFAVRREWRALAVAAATMTGVLLLSSLYTPPREWLEWVRMLIANAGSPIDSGSLPLPLVLRWPAALLIVAWGAHTNRRWVVPIAGLLALPVIWYGSLSLLLAVIPLARPGWTAWPWGDALDRARVWLAQRVGVRGTQSA
jgi:hypothetical protein